MTTFAHTFQVCFFPRNKRLLRWKELPEYITDSCYGEPDDIIITPWCCDGYPEWDLRLTAYAQGKDKDDIGLEYGTVGPVEIEGLSKRFYGCVSIDRIKSRFLGQKSLARHLVTQMPAMTAEESLDVACLIYDELLKPWADDNGKGKPAIPEYFVQKALGKNCECLDIEEAYGGTYWCLKEENLDDFERCIFKPTRSNPLTIVAGWYAYADPKRDYETYDAYLFDDWTTWRILGAEPDEK